MKKSWLLEEVARRSSRLDALVESLVARTLRSDRPLTPAELLADVATDLERAVTLGPDGPVFPYNRVIIDVRAENAARASEIKGALPAEQVTSTIADRLRRHCTVPDDLRVELRTTASESGAPATYDIALRTVRRPAPAPAEPPTARLVRADGLGRFTLREGTFNVGRVAEAHGRDGRLIRRNQIVLDGEDGSRTVSRVHARIEGIFRDGTLVFLVYDDGSRHGSTIVREGRAHKVHRGAIGVALRDGDEVYFGKVRLEFRMR